MKELRCKFCGEVKDELLRGSEVCKDCQEAIDDFGNEDLIMALAEEFGCGVQDIVDLGHNRVQIDGYEYKIFTEDEANDAVADYIADTLWAFTPSFLSGLTGIDEEVFELLSEKCEGGNEAIHSILRATNVSMSEVVDEAIRWDGRGHFLNSYDGNEYEVSVNGEYYFLYRD
jgi:hypothetical protein